MKAGSQIVWGGLPGAIAPGSLYQLRMGGTMNEAATAPTIAPAMTKMRTVFTAPLCHAQAGEGSLRAVLRDQPPRDARREGHDGDLRVHPDAGGEEARVDHVDADHGQRRGAHARHGGRDLDHDTLRVVQPVDEVGLERPAPGAELLLEIGG